MDPVAPSGLLGLRHAHEPGLDHCAVDRIGKAKRKIQVSRAEFGYVVPVTTCAAGRRFLLVGPNPMQ